jgi:hypothetical protein
MAEDYADDVKNRFKKPFSSTAFNTKESFPVDPGCSHRPDKRASNCKKSEEGKAKRARSDGLREEKEKREEKKRSTRSQQFLSSFKKAKHEPFKLRNKPKCRISPKTVFKVFSVNTGKLYNVEVKKSPSCSCEYFSSNDRSRRQVCKHLIWVYLYVLQVHESSEVIQQVALTDQEVKNIFAGANEFAPPNVFGR